MKKHHVEVIVTDPNRKDRHRAYKPFQRKKTVIVKASDPHEAQKTARDFVRDRRYRVHGSDHTGTTDMKKEETINERLTIADPLSAWISDFVNSTSPRFSGKSKGERTRMAIAARANAAGSSNESTLYRFKSFISNEEI